MKTAVIENGKDNKAVKNQSTDKSAIRPAVPLKDNANQVDPDGQNQKKIMAKMIDEEGFYQRQSQNILM